MRSIDDLYKGAGNSHELFALGRKPRGKKVVGKQASVKTTAPKKTAIRKQRLVKKTQDDHSVSGAGFWDGLWDGIKQGADVIGHVASVALPIAAQVAPLLAAGDDVKQKRSLLNTAVRAALKNVKDDSIRQEINSVKLQIKGRLHVLESKLLDAAIKRLEHYAVKKVGRLAVKKLDQYLQ